MYKFSKLAAGSVVAATAAIGGTSVALADGYAPQKIAYERPSNWSGVYFGVASGWQWSSIDVSEPGIPGGFSDDHSSGIVGGHIGLQHQFGSVVLGVEGGYTFALRDRQDLSNCPSPNFSCTARFDDVLTIGGRVGWAAGRWMPYVTGGYAAGRYTYQAFTKGTPLVPFEQASSRNDGWYIGGGVEWAVSSGWMMGLEYRHYDFDAATTTAFTTGGTPTFLRTIDPTTDTVTARVSWKFGRPEPAPLK